MPYVKVDPNVTSSECPKYNYKGLEEIGYRRFRCPRCGFKADRDVTGKLNVRKRGLRKLGIKFSGRSLATPTVPQMTDVAQNRWGEPMIRLKEMTTNDDLRAGEEVRCHEKIC